MRLLALPMPQLQSASVGVFLRVGSRDETPATNGISHVLEHMAFKGTATRDVQAINLDAERLGAEVNAFTSKDTTAYFMSGLGRHAPRFLDMVADIVLESVFPPEELQRELEVIRQEAIEYDEDPQDFSSDLLDRAIWAQHPMGMPVIGTVENIEKFTRDDLLAHVQRHYLARNTVVVAAGNIDAEEFFAAASQRFAGMRTGPAPSPGEPPPHVGGALGRRYTEVSQVFLGLAYPVTPPALSELPQQRWRLAASISAILFGGGMAAPWVDTVRERMGLAYHAESSIETGDTWGHFLLHTVTTPDKLEALLAATGRLLQDQAQAIDPVHLERAKNQLTYSRVRSAERSHATMERAVEELFASGTVTPLAATLDAIESITAEEARAVFAQMLRHPPALAIAGKGATAKAARQLATLLA